MDQPPPHFVSVVVPHYNDLDNLGRCLDRLRGQSWPADRVEIIVADNNSTGGLAAVQAIAHDLRAVSAPEQGAGPARNAGAAVAKGEVLAFIDSDCLADRDWLAQGLAALERFDYAGGQVITTIADPARITPSEAYEAVFAFDFRRYIEKRGFAGSGNLFVPRRVFEQVGGFRAGVAEDIDWCRRANAMGFRLGYAPDAIVHHAARRRWSELKHKHDRILRETIRLERERPGWQPRWIVRALAIAGSPLLHWIRVVRSPRLPGARAKLRGIAGLALIRGYRSYRMLSLLGRRRA
jgi:GT2 family glycosyltransferase